MTDLKQFSNSYGASYSDGSRRAGSTKTVFVESVLVEPSEELALELFNDTIRTVLEPALLTVPLRG